MKQFASGELVGNGAAYNLEIGWIPDVFEIANVTDGDVITRGYVNRMSIPFSGGGTNEIAAGTRITGVTSHARATVKEVLLYSGTWAAGDAAGFFIIERETLTGTFTSENIVGEVAGATDDATVTANVTHSVAITTAVATVTTTSAITAYVGAAGTNAKGVTIGSVVMEEAKLLRWTAWRNG